MTADDPAVASAVVDLIKFLETGDAPPGLFAPDVFVDLTLPRWRIQGTTAEELLAIRKASHPCVGQVRVERVERTGHGLTMEFEERWTDQGEHWHAREMLRADLGADGITELSIYCTGDWDEARRREHAAAVTLVRS